MTIAATGRRSTLDTCWPTTGAAELRIRPLVLVLAVVAGVAIGVSIDVWRAGSPTRWLAYHEWVAPYGTQGRLVDVGGRSMYLDCRGSGSPTVAFEAGAGGGADGWGVVFPETAAFTRACVYDRAGLLRSDTDPSADRTAADVADDLATLLAAAGERPPFVLVGHSLGGVYARVFADRYPDAVAGIVLDDAFNPDLFGAQVAAAPADLRDDWLADMDATYRLIESVERIDWTGSATDLAAVSLGDLPIEAVMASRRDPRLTDEQAASVDAAWRAALETLSADTRVTIAEGAGHFVHLTRPDLMLGAIRRLVEATAPG